MRTPSKLLPDIDYTIEGGKIILSESFLLRRGFCCNTKCRHCPYGKERAGAPVVILGLPAAPVGPLAPLAGAAVRVGAPALTALPTDAKKTG